MFYKGDTVRDKYTGQVFTVKKAYWQHYDGPDTADWTVEFEPTTEQPTPWNKGSNLELVARAAITKAQG